MLPGTARQQREVTNGDPAVRLLGGAGQGGETRPARPPPSIRLSLRTMAGRLIMRKMGLPSWRPPQKTSVAAVVVAVGLATLAAPRLLTRPLRCENESAPAESYRQRFFLRIAFAEAAALVGFIGFILSGAGWLYSVGALFSAIGFARLAPTSGHLRQDQEDLRRRGCNVSLISALRQFRGSQ